MPMNKAPTVTEVTSAISAYRVDPTLSVHSSEKRVRIMTMLPKQKWPAEYATTNSD